jgi:prevent-host-death family protein
MKNMTASEFKAKCLKELDNLPEEGIVITKHGKPVAKVVPIKKKNFMDFYGCMKGKLKINGDIYSTGAWDDWTPDDN